MRSIDRPQHTPPHGAAKAVSKQQQRRAKQEKPKPRRFARRETRRRHVVQAARSIAACPKTFAPSLSPCCGCLLLLQHCGAQTQHCDRRRACGLGRIESIEIDSNRDGMNGMCPCQFHLQTVLASERTGFRRLSLSRFVRGVLLLFRRRRRMMARGSAFGFVGD
jgi:hypothetical protein